MDSRADQWSSQDKFRVVLESASLNAWLSWQYCRRKGLYVEQIQRLAQKPASRPTAWLNRAKTQREREEEKAAKKRIKQLERELRRRMRRWQKPRLCWCCEKSRGALGKDEDE